MRIVGGCVAACLASLLLGSAARAAETWTVQDGSAIRFIAYQEGAQVEGSFKDFTAEIVFAPGDLAASRVAVAIDTASITTSHKDRDTTLRSSAFFDVRTWPRAAFVSDRLVHQGGDKYEAYGQLTIRAVTQDVVLPFELTIEQTSAGRVANAVGDLTISRLDYGVGQGEWASTKTVGEEVVVRIEIVAAAPG